MFWFLGKRLPTPFEIFDDNYVMLDSDDDAPSQKNTLNQLEVDYALSLETNHTTDYVSGSEEELSGDNGEDVVFEFLAAIAAL